MSLLPPADLLWGFVMASLALALTPGPGVLFIVARSAMQGRSAALASVAGVALGNLGNALFAALGLAVIFAVIPLAFDVVRYLGAAWLVYLGIRAIRDGSRPPLPGAGRDTAAKVMADGLLVALFNPKTTMFFAAFLPQFLPAGSTGPLPIAMLGALFVGIAAITDSIYALSAQSITRSVHFPDRMVSVGRYASGAIFIALGCLAALSGRPRG